MDVRFKPLPGSQTNALSCPCNEILLHGTRGSSKTLTQLMKFRKNVGLGYGPYYRGVIFDREYKDLDDAIRQSKIFFNNMGDGARFLASKGDLKWIWPTGEELLFRKAKTEDDYWSYHGQEFPFIGFNELTKQPDDGFYTAIRSCNRSSFIPPPKSGIPPIKLQVVSTTNPYGPGHSWVKKRFIDRCQPGEVQRIDLEVQNPQTRRKEIISITRTHIFSSYRENPYLDPIYIATLEQEKDPNKKKAWLEGDWNVAAGGRFSDLWREELHVIKPFRIPFSWHVNRSHDWGEAKPFSNLWFAESDGTAATLPDGRHWAPYPGTLIMIGEWYGTAPKENTGLDMTSADVGRYVTQIDEYMSEMIEERPLVDGHLNVIHGICGRVNPGPADTSIFSSHDNHCISENMAAEGCYWVEDSKIKAPGTRKSGATIIRDRLDAVIKADESESGNLEAPGVYFFNICQSFISRFPMLPRSTKDPDDVDTDAEDHDYDAFRYRALHKPIIFSKARVAGF